MALSLSAATAPALTLGELDAACRARGLDGQEARLRSADDAAALVDEALASSARVVAIRADVLDARMALPAARASARLGVPVSVPPGGLALPGLPELGVLFQEEGGRLLVSHGTRRAEALALVEAIAAAGAPPSLGLAWDLRPSAEPLAEAGAVLVAARDRLGLVRLHGGGPEQTRQDGLGIGPLLVDLALSGYAGPIVLCPSDEAELPRWSEWLASKKSAGCGSRVDARTLVLDVREVEPKDRLETILGAYRSLMPGATLKLTVDHDPSCMYHMLEATEPEGSFAFRVLEDGPEVWRAEVARR